MLTYQFLFARAATLCSGQLPSYDDLNKAYRYQKVTTAVAYAILTQIKSGDTIQMNDPYGIFETLKEHYLMYIESRFALRDENLRQERIASLNEDTRSYRQ